MYFLRSRACFAAASCFFLTSGSRGSCHLLILPLIVLGVDLSCSHAVLGSSATSAWVGAPRMCAGSDADDFNLRPLGALWLLDAGGLGAWYWIFPSGVLMLFMSISPLATLPQSSLDCGVG